MKKYSLFIKLPYLNHIKNGEKTLEGRANYPNLRNIVEGDQITFLSGNKSVHTEVERISVYPTVKSMLDSEEVTELIPDASFEEAQDIYNAIYSPEKVKKNNGMRVFAITKKS